MQEKWSRYRVYLPLGLLVALPLAFLLTRGLFRTDAQTDHVTFSSIEELSEEDHPSGDSSAMQQPNDELRNIIPPLDLRLAGTGLVGGKNAYAVIVDQTIDEQGLYRVGESIRGARVVKIDRECVILEKDGFTQVLKVTRGRNTVSGPSVIQASVGPSFTGISEELPPFEPIVSETGPPVDESMPVEDLPPFQPITSETGPPVDPEQVHEDLPEFTPFVSESGPG